ncbi:Gfo/Idh/MocA family protein [Streptosporangium sandarakinum]|uniref:Gfo/Idh/MocA family protein n=1 Tax=Streptosporangium sandarakinum TaxID=1260955 RepID=UPI0037982168
MDGMSAAGDVNAVTDVNAAESLSTAGGMSVTGGVNAVEGLSAAGSVNMASRPVRMAVLGAADIARRRMLPAMTRVAGVEPVVVAGRRPAETGRLAAEFGVEAAGDYETALLRDDVEAVYLPLPNALHAPWAERALRAGRHVLAEKPLTTCAADTARLQRLADERGLVLMEAMMFVHHAQHEEVRRLLDGGALGTPLAFTAAFTVPPRDPGDIRYRAGLGGGALLDTGVYPLRAAQHLLGGDLEVLGAVLRCGDEVDVGGAALLVSPRGVTAQVEFGFDRPYRCSYEIRGSRGGLLLDRAFTPPADLTPVARRTGLDGRTGDLPLRADDQFAALLRSFARAVRTGERHGDAAASLVQARLVDRIRETARRVPA